MFGYVIPEKSELRVRELALYQAYYCGLCKTIGKREGPLARLTLSYDCSYIAMLLSGAYGCGGCYEGRCAFKPFGKPRAIASRSGPLNFAADVNVLLTWYKLRDDWRDEKRVPSRLAMAALSRAKRRASANAPSVAEAIEKGIGELSALERTGCRELDAPADAFARMIRSVIASYNQADQAKGISAALELTAYNIGKWIYLADAWDDREKDAGTGAYNPFLAAEADAARAAFVLNFTLNEAIKAYDLANIRANKGVLDNIMYEGCVNRTRKIIGGKNEQPV